MASFLLAPVIAQGLWRPLVHVFGSAGSANRVTGAALAISATLALVQAPRRNHGLLLSLAPGALVAVAASAGLSLGVPGLLALLGVTVVIALLSRWLLPRLPTTLDGLASRHRLLTALYVVVALAVLTSTVRLSVFIGDPTRVDDQVLPGVDFLSTHSCLTAYVHAGTLSWKHVHNLYDVSWWRGSHGLEPAAAEVENPYRPFNLDYYAYPPPFLLVVAPLALLDGDYPAQRALWFGLNGLFLALGLWLVARWIDGPGAHRALLLAPLLFGSLPVLATLQVGNFQVAVVVISVLAMMAFERDRPALGGALLAFAILAKISPGVLGILLLAQRRWRGVAWTMGFGVLFIALSLLTIGVDPMASFIRYTLPRISSGEAFAFMDDTTFSMLVNTSPFGLPFKLQLLGLEVKDPWAAGRRIGHVYTLILVIVAVIAARRPIGDRREQALIWMSLLVLSALQSPFAPGYVIIGLLWAITLLTTEVRSLRGGVTLLAVWFGLTFAPLTHGLAVMAAFTMFQSALALAVPIWLIARPTRLSA